MRAFAGQDRDRMLRNHRSHVGDIIDRLLAPDEVEGEGEDDNAPRKIPIFAFLLLYMFSINESMITAIVAPMINAM